MAVPSAANRQSSTKNTSSRSTVTGSISWTITGSGRTGRVMPSSSRRRSAIKVPA